jgi:hypothetical protein
MHNLCSLRGVAAALVGGALTVAMSGCGKLSIESWVVIDGAKSSGSVSVNGGAPQNLTDLQGGFLGLITVDTTKLPGPLSGPISVEDVRIATGSPFGTVCISADASNPSTGSISLNVLAGQGSATLDLNLIASALGQQTKISQAANLNLSGVSLNTLLNASNTGSAAGLFDTTTSFSSSATILGIPVTFDLSLTVTNQETLPPLDASAATCAAQFAANGLPQGLFYGLNSKSSYLIASNGDKPQPPLVIKLSDVGAVPGNKLQITRIGTFADSQLLSNGNLTQVSGLFSSSNTVLGTNVQNRIPGAIQSFAPMFFTPFIFKGFFIQPTDIPQDFLIDPSITVVVPNGAAYLVVAPFSPNLVWGNDSGFDLGVALQVVK